MEAAMNTRVWIRGWKACGTFAAAVTIAAACMPVAGAPRTANTVSDLALQKSPMIVEAPGFDPNAVRLVDCAHGGAPNEDGAWPSSYWWPRGGAIAAGVAVGYVNGKTASAWAGEAPSPNGCWYFTERGGVLGFWDLCP